MRKVFVFPGQGAQFSGMGRDLYDNYSEARSMMERANTILGFRLTDVMFDGTDDDLRETRVTQPAIFLHSVVSAMVNTTLTPDAVAGHSLGEYSALVANGALRFDDAVSLVSERALAMQDACDQNPGTMAAVMGMEDEEVTRICQSLDGVVAANYNSPGQVVISGSMEGINMACPVLKEAGAKRVLRLPVGGAFHSPLMQPAAERLGRAIERTTFYTPRCPIYQNAIATAVTSPDEIRHNLQAQLTSPVRWTESVRQMIADGITDFYEFGPGDVLKGLIKKIDSQIARCFCMLFLLGSSLLASAAVRTPDEAMQIAQQHFTTATTATGAHRVARASSLSHIATYPRTDEAAPAFYIFGQEQSGGYVLVSADDRTEAVLGYSDQGVFDPNDVPAAMRELLQSYQEQMALLDQPYPINRTIVCTDSVLPLLNDIQWNQSAPYNNLCPQMSASKRAATGCAATATAQVMRFWRHPVRGTGSHSYTTKTQGYELSADFNVLYDWKNMLPQYKKDQYTTAQANAVAQLMYHVGVGAEMNYNSDDNGSSGASLSNIAYALYTYFGYDHSLRYYKRMFYPGSWDELLRSELRAGRPIIHEGYCTGGHAFVCDGFDRYGYFHFNWGWGGSSDGYFLTCILVPSGLGIGAGSGVYSFSQGCLIGVKPDAGGSLYSGPTLGYNNAECVKDSVGLIGSLSFRMNNLSNAGLQDYTGDVAMLVINDKNQIISIINKKTIKQLRPGYYYSTYTFTGNLTTISNGQYRVVMACKPQDSESWYLVPSEGGSPYYFNLEVTSTYRKVTGITDGQTEMLMLQVEALETPYSDGTSSSQVLTNYHFSVTNQGHAYCDSVRFLIRSWEDDQLVDEMGLVLLDIANGETFEFQKQVAHHYIGKIYVEMTYRDQVLRCYEPTHYSVYNISELRPNTSSVTTTTSGDTTSICWQGNAPFYITTLSGTNFGQKINYVDTIRPDADGNFELRYHLETNHMFTLRMAYVDNARRINVVSSSFIYVPTPTALPNTSENAEGWTAKIIKNGQVVILRNNNEYNILGQ